MQYNDIISLKKASPVRFMGYFLKGAIFVAVCIFIVLKVREHPIGIAEVSETMANRGKVGAIGWLALLFFLTIVNWLLEAIKWKMLSDRIEKMSLWQSIQGVLAGLSLGFVTPHALGDYAGRIWHLKNDKRLESLGAIMLGRALQFFPTFAFGLLGVFYFFFDNDNTVFKLLAWVGIPIVLLGGASLCIYGRRYFMKIMFLRPFRKYAKYFTIVSQYSHLEMMSFIGLAFGRYIVFGSQFMILLILLGASKDVLLLLAGVTWTFLGKSTIPSFNFLSDLGVREFSALFFFSQFHVDAMPVVFASFSLWCFNLLLPSIAGLVGVGGMKIFRKP